MKGAVCIVKAIIVKYFKFLVLVRRKDGLLDLPGGKSEKGRGCLSRPCPRSVRGNGPGGWKTAPGQPVESSNLQGCVKRHDVLLRLQTRQCGPKPRAQRFFLAGSGQNQPISDPTMGQKVL